MNETLMAPSISVPTSADFPVEHHKSQQWHLAREVPVAFIYNGHPHAVMMATPQDLEDFAIGFSLSEEVVTERGAIEDIYIEQDEEAFRVFLSIDETKTGPGYQQKRTIAGRTSCGLCGVAELEAAVRVSPNKHAHVTAPAPEVLIRSLQSFHQAQHIHKVNYSVHGAAFYTMDGELLLMREDVGRHNALDKLLGALALRSPAPQGYVVMSSRCSFELVKKAVAFGLCGLVTISAPTSLALEIAKKSNLFLACQDGPERLTFF